MSALLWRRRRTRQKSKNLVARKQKQHEFGVAQARGLHKSARLCHTHHMKILFRKAMTQKIEDNIAALAKRGEQLVVKRAKAQDALDKATKARQDALLSGDLDDQRAIDRLQAAVDTAKSALTGIDDALAVLARQKAEAEAALDTERQRVQRITAADALEKRIAVIEASAAPWPEQSRIYADALAELAHWHFGADEMSKFLQNCMAQMETAANFQLTKLKAMPGLIREGHQAIPADKPKLVSVAPVEQPAPTMTVFMIRSARYRDHDGHKRFAGQFEDAIMPVPTAQKAMRLGLAVSTADPLRATHHGARGGDFRPDAADVVDIDEGEEHSGIPYLGPDKNDPVAQANFSETRGPERKIAIPVHRV
jgi:hypothetical protein